MKPADEENSYLRRRFRSAYSQGRGERGLEGGLMGGDERDD